MIVAHLAASPFIGGPEAQMLGLIGQTSKPNRSALLSFSEGGRCRPLLDAVSAFGAETVELTSNAPQYRASVAEIAEHLRRLDADVLCCHGYKPDILGMFAAKAAKVPVVSISHGWTAATWKVRLNELADRLALRGMDRVVCVSEAQAKRVRSAGISPRKTVVIHNAIDIDRYQQTCDPLERSKLFDLFPKDCETLIGSVGRLSQEKGFGVLVEAAAIVTKANPKVGFLHFGDGVERPKIERAIADRQLERRFVLGGFRNDLPSIFPAFDLFVLPSFTEGLPCVVLEAFAGGVPVVATRVGGTPEVVDDGFNGRLVPPGDPESLADAILKLVEAPDQRATFGERGRALVADQFTFDRQARLYEQLFDTIAKFRRPAKRQRSKAVR